MSRYSHVILITVDCLRADHVGCISGCNLTPKIDTLAKKSMIFHRAFSNGPSTSQSFPSILASTYFLLNDGLRLNPSCITLSEVLSNEGYKTVAFHSNPFLSTILGWNKGFNEYYDFIENINGTSAFITKLQRAGLIGEVARFAVGNFTKLDENKVQNFLKKNLLQVY